MLKILLVDDDPDELPLFKSAVSANSNQELDIIQLEDCNNIHEKILHLKPDLIFMDINMPGLDGISCLKVIRAEKEFENIPIIMYSTSKNEIKIGQCYDNRANLYVVKPFNYAEIEKVLGKVVNMDWKKEQRRERSNFVIK